MRNIVACGALLSALIGFPAMAQGQGYRLLVERGVDATAVRHILADSMGEPAEIAWLSPQGSVRPANTGRTTIVVARPDLIRAAGGSTISSSRVVRDLARILPGDSLAIGRID